jgi:dephospho-CoA kinase
MVIGLTGSFGTGKSSVAAHFRKLGAKVLDADSIARETLESGTPEYRRVVRVFGPGILNSSRSINRKKLARMVFGDRKLVARLNGIVHPAVIRRIRSEIRKVKRGVLVVDAPLIFEAGISALFDHIVVVKASRHKQISRCIKKSGMDKEEVCDRIACQTPLRQKLKMADYIIDNDGTRVATKKQVVEIWQRLKRKGTT